MTTVLPSSNFFANTYEKNMASVKDSFLDLERHIIQLETNVKTLKSALEHWRKWDAEYEALKEEVSAASKDGAREAADLLRVREGFEGELVNGKEVAEIFGEGRARRSASQIIGVVGRRLDYVGTNLQSLEKKINEAERKLEAAKVVSDPGATDEDGLPITEIFESLDEEGNVTSHELWTPGSKRLQVEEILGKAGVKKRVAQQGEVEEIQSGASSKISNAQDKQQLSDRSPPALAPEVPSGTSTRNGSLKADEVKKVINQVEPSEQPNPSEQPDVSKAAQRVQRIMDNAREQEDISKQEPVIPVDESMEDAALRQQMLDYGMSNNIGGMGEVVAVMNDLRFENSDDDDEFNSFSDDDDDWDEDDDEDEDKWGRSTGRLVSDTYQDRMLELEQRLGVQSRFTRKLAEQATANEDEDDDDEQGIGKIVIKDTGASAEKKSSRDSEAPVTGVLKSETGEAKPKKSVRFAGSLDIAPEESERLPEKSAKKPAAKRPEAENPVAELIVEQSGPQKSEPPTPAETKPRRQSRFKQLKSTASKPAAMIQDTEPKVEKKPSEESGIMEELSWSETVPEKNIDGDFDGEITKREIADEYQRRRRRMIEKQGGFLKEDESPVQDDEARPMSKFRAARLSKQ